MRCTAPFLTYFSRVLNGYRAHFLSLQFPTSFGSQPIHSWQKNLIAFPLVRLTVVVFPFLVLIMCFTAIFFLLLGSFFNLFVSFLFTPLESQGFITQLSVRRKVMVNYPITGGNFIAFSYSSFIFSRRSSLYRSSTM